MNIFHSTGDFFSFAARRGATYCFRDETNCDTDIAEKLQSLGGNIMETVNGKIELRMLARPLALLAALIACAPVSAGETEPAYTMTVIVDNAYGSKVAAGDYERAIEKITAAKRTRDPYSKQTNLCVAYTKIGELDKATEACEAALAIMLDARKSRKGAPGIAHSGRMERLYLALALSNLGVVHAARGSEDAARRTFHEAVELDTSLSAPRTNLARIAKGETPSA